MSSRPPTPAALGTAARIAVALYVTGVLILPLLGRFVKVAPAASAATMRLAPVLAVVALADYATSLWIEHILLRAIEQKGAASGIGVLIIMMAAFGFAIALYGFILSLLGVARWPLFFYLLCFAHGVHLLARAQNYPRPAGS